MWRSFLVSLWRKVRRDPERGEVAARVAEAATEKMPAVVFACLLPGELRIVLWPGYGMANGVVPWDVPVNVIPPELRMPNPALWVQR